MAESRLDEVKQMLSEVSEAARNVYAANVALQRENITLRCLLVLCARQLAIERQRVEDLTEIAWGLMGGDDEYSVVAAAPAGEAGK